ncbi:histidine phosphatase family protein [Vagococcus sp. JNUCC 83]
MKKTLFLMRHGQTLFNKLGKIQGSCDSPLTNEGIAQAKVAKQYFIDNDIQIDSFYSSTQERACDTLEIVSGHQNYSRLKGLKEWDFGLFEGESERLNPKRKEGETSFGDSFVPYGGESSQKVQKRMVDTLTSIMNEEKNDSTLAVSHGGAMYLFIQAWLEFERVKNISFSNCCILKFSFENDKFTFIEAINHTF